MTERALVDINVLLDVLAKRGQDYAASAAVWAAAEKGTLDALVSANSMTVLYYVLRKLSSAATARRGIRLVNQVFAVVPVDAEVIARALESDLRDFEDAVQCETALQAHATVIITRDVRHYRRAAVPALTPEAFLARADSEHGA